MNKEFLYEMLDTMSVSGHEVGLQKKVIREMTPYAHEVRTDYTGNVVCVLNPEAEFKVLLRHIVVVTIDFNGILRLNAPIRVATNVVKMGNSNHSLNGIHARAVRGRKHNATGVDHAVFMRVIGDFGEVFHECIGAELCNLIRQLGGHLLVKSLLKELLAGRAVAGPAVIACLLEAGLIPEERLASGLTNVVDPGLGKLSEFGLVKAGLKGRRRAVGEDHLALGVNGRPEKLIAGASVHAPVVHPNLKAGILGGLHDVLHQLWAADHIVMRVHMYNGVHVVARNVAHVRIHLMQKTVAVVCSTKLQGSFHSKILFSL